MFNLQANTARYSYTLSIKEPKTEPKIKLKNNYYFNKEAKSDEKLLYTETQIYSLISTVLIMHLLNYYPQDSITSLIYNDNATFSTVNISNFNENLNVYDLKNILDSVFGHGFSFVAKKPLLKFNEFYKRKLIYVKYGTSINLPTTQDFINLYRFLNTQNPSYSSVVKFLVGNTLDHKFPTYNKPENL